MLMRLVVLTAVLLSGIVTAQAVAFSRAMSQPLSGTAIVWQGDGNSQGQNGNSQGQNGNSQGNSQMPEPGTLALVVAGLLGTIAVARKTVHK
jgi:hypothetical protein